MRCLHNCPCGGRVARLHLTRLEAQTVRFMLSRCLWLRCLHNGLCGGRVARLIVTRLEAFSLIDLPSAPKRTSKPSAVDQPLAHGRNSRPTAPPAVSQPLSSAHHHRHHRSQAVSQPLSLAHHHRHHRSQTVRLEVSICASVASLTQSSSFAIRTTCGL